MQATAGALVPHPRKSIKQFSAYKMPELLVESKSKLDFAKEWPEEAASHVRAVHQGSTEREAVSVPRLVTWMPGCMCQEVAVVQSLSHVPLSVTQ